MGSLLDAQPALIALSDPVPGLVGQDFDVGRALGSPSQPALIDLPIQWRAS
jgi:hypothetical protein